MSASTISKSAALPLGYAPSPPSPLTYRETGSAAISPPAADHRSGLAPASMVPARAAAARSAKSAKQVAPLPLIRAKQRARKRGRAPPRPRDLRDESRCGHRSDRCAAATAPRQALRRRAGIGANRPASPNGPRRAAKTAAVGSAQARVGEQDAGRRQCRRGLDPFANAADPDRAGARQAGTSAPSASAERIERCSSRSAIP